MDATITNLGSTSPDDDLFLTLGRVQVKAGETVTIPDVTTDQLDGDPTLRQLVTDGKVSVSVSPDARDAAAATQGSLGFNHLPLYAVADLPTGFQGRQAFATDGRTGAEAAGAGTGVMVVYSNGDWRRVEDMAIVAA